MVIDWSGLVEYLSLEVISNLISGLALLLIAYVTYRWGKKQSEKEFEAQIKLMEKHHNEEMSFQRKRAEDEQKLATEQLNFEKQKYEDEKAERNKPKPIGPVTWNID